MSDIEMECTPPDIKEAAEKAEENLLPQKSRLRYEKAYNTYKDWCVKKGVTKAESENIVLAYFSEMAKNKKSSTLWAIYSMIKTTLIISDKIDISKYGKLMAFLKRQNINYKPKKSNTFTQENIDTFLDEAPDEFLVQKVGLVIGLSGACRSDELFKMEVQDIDILKEKISIIIPHTKTYQARTFMIINIKWVEIVKKYIELRSGIQNERFFMQMRFGKITNQVFGHNSIAQFPKKIASFLKLKNVDEFTGQSFRRTGTSATLLVNNGGDVLQLKRLGGWKSSTVAEGYVDTSSSNQTANMVSGQSTSSNPSSVTIKCSLSMSSSMSQELAFSSKEIGNGLMVTVAGHDKSNITINFNNVNNP